MRIIKMSKLFVSALLALDLFYVSVFRIPKEITNPAKELPWPFNIDLTFFDIYKNWAYPARFNIPIILIILALIMEVADQIIEYNYTKKEKLENVLKTIINAELFINTVSSRITVFKKYNGFMSILKYSWRCLITNYFSHSNKKMIPLYFRNLPKINRDYLFVYKRKGIPNEKMSSVNFIVPRNKDEICGIMTFSILHEQYQQIYLEPIKDIDLSKALSIDDVPKKQRNKVRDYMCKGMIKEFDRLRMIHRHATNIAVTPLFRGNKLWGSVIIDNDSDHEIFNRKEKEIKTYFNIIKELI